MSGEDAIRLVVVDDEPDIGLLLSAQFRLTGDVEVVGVAHEGGRLWVEARPGGGLLTYLELPAA